MKTNIILGGVAAALFSMWTVGCASPTVQRSTGDNDTSSDKSSGSSSNDSASSSSSSSSTPSKSSTATTTGTTTTTTGSGSGTTTPPAGTDPLACKKLDSCADTIDNVVEQIGYYAAAAAGDQDVCQVSLIACKVGGISQFFGNECDDLQDCCDEMGQNGNSSEANTCRAKANMNDVNACKTQASTYRSKGLCR